MPDVVVPLLVLALGAGLLIAGAEAFAENVAAAAAGLGTTVLALGVLLAGAEPEEAVTAVLASSTGHPGLAAGDPVGSNLVVLTLALGTAALIRPLRMGRRARAYAGAAAVAGSVAWLLLRDGLLSRVDGLLLVLLYVVGAVWVWRRERIAATTGGTADTGDDGPGGTGRDGSHGRALPLVVGGVVGGLLAMVLGGALAVRGAQGLVDLSGLGETTVGLTVLGFATSAETIALVGAARRRGLSELVVAGTVGAVACNATLSLGLAALVRPLGLGRHDEVAAVAGVTALLPLLLLAAARGGRLPRAVGALLVLAYPVSLVVLLAR